MKIFTLRRSLVPSNRKDTLCLGLEAVEPVTELYSDEVSLSMEPSVPVALDPG